MPTEPAQVKMPYVKEFMATGAPQPSVVTMCWPAGGNRGRQEHHGMLHKPS